MFRDAYASEKEMLQAACAINLRARVPSQA